METQTKIKLTEEEIQAKIAASKLKRKPEVVPEGTKLLQEIRDLEAQVPVADLRYFYISNVDATKKVTAATLVNREAGQIRIAFTFLNPEDDLDDKNVGRKFAIKRLIDGGPFATERPFTGSGYNDTVLAFADMENKPQTYKRLKVISRLEEV